MFSHPMFPAGPAVPVSHPHGSAGPDGSIPLSRRALGLAAGAALLAAQTGRADAQPRPRPVATMLVYPGMILLDLTGPLTVFNIMGAEIHLVWKDRSLVPTDVGLPVQPTATLAEAPKDPDILFVPGGLGGTVAAMGIPEVEAFLAACGAGAKWVTSVCTGSLLLGAAGLLRGYAATSHWYVVDQLAALGAMPRHDRVVTDRNRMTGGGVTAGLDFGLTLAARMAGEDTAKRIQLLLEYAPKPPFDAGEPDSAGKLLTDAVLTARARALAQARAAVAAARNRLAL